MKTDTHIPEDSIGKLLSQYYEGNLTENESAQLDDLAQNDPFLKEAMEGYAEFPEAANQLPNFKPRSSFWNSLSVTIAIISVAILGIAISGLLTPQELIQQEAKLVTTNVPTTHIEKPQKPVVVMDNQIEEKSIPKVIRKKVEKQKKEIAKPNNVAKTPVREQIELPKIELDPVQFQAKIDYTVKRAKTKAIGYFGFLAVDYSQIYTNTIETEPQFSGTDASQANLKSKSTILDNGLTRNIYTYREFLKQTCYLMKEKNYSLAISNLRIIQKEFPGDVNAEFYLGYCYYEIGKYEKAIPYFDKAMNNGFDFFVEDAQWFKANSLENLGRYTEANRIYKAIKEKGGYYSVKMR